MSQLGGGEGSRVGVHGRAPSCARAGFYMLKQYVLGLKWGVIGVLSFQGIFKTGLFYTTADQQLTTSAKKNLIAYQIGGYYSKKILLVYL